jgi:hypothetical protein
VYRTILKTIMSHGNKQKANSFINLATISFASRTIFRGVKQVNCSQMCVIEFVLCMKTANTIGK